MARLATIDGRLALGSLGHRKPEEAAIGEPAERHAEAGGDVPDRVEGAIVGDDLDHIAGPRAGQPDARGDRDAKVAPVSHAHGRRAVDQLGAVAREQPGGVVPDDAPVADGEELGAPVRAVHRQMRKHTRDVLRPARVLDVEEDGPPAGRHRALGRRRGDPRGKGRLGYRER